MTRTGTCQRWLVVSAMLALTACGSAAAGGDEAARGDNSQYDAESYAGAGGAGGIGGNAGFGGVGGISAGATGGTGGAGGWGGGPALPASVDPSEQPLPTDDRFTDVGTNPFVMVAHDPFSTFAADVDTASYDLFRRDINRNVLPVSDSVRVEEYVNYFTYDYAPPAADAEHPFAIGVARSANPFGETEIVRVAIQAKAPTQVAKLPVNLVFLVDVSGSMQSPEKLPVVKETLAHTLDVLDPNDTVSIVTYASGTAVRLTPTRVFDADLIRASIDGLSAGGSTNGAGGIQLAYEQARAGFIDGGRNHVILCTDGDFNVGASSDEALVELIEEERKSGVTLTALGYGIGNLNDSMMEKVSNAGNGIYAVISSETQARVYVEDRMLSTIEHVAKDMKIQLEWNPEHVLAYRLIGYENRAIADEDFRVDTVDAGEVGAGHRVTALYEVVPVAGEVPSPQGAPAALDGAAVEGEREVGTDELVRIKVRYKHVGASEQDPALEVTAALLPEVPLAEDADLSFAMAVAQLAEILKHSPYGDVENMPTVLEVIAAQRGRDLYREELDALARAADTLLRP